jgi:Tol biopolymer transport system component
MKHSKAVYFFILIALISLSITVFSDSGEPEGVGKDIKGDYLGQKPPGTTPEVFAPGIVSTDEVELNSVFTPDGTEFYYSVRKDEKYTILFMRQENGIWTEPRVAPFSTSYSNVDMCVSHDGKKMFYGSNRPLSGQGDAESGYDIWVVDREGSSWGEPRNVDPGVNSGEHQIYPTVTMDGTLYFQSRREGNLGGSDVYRSRFVNGRYLEPENLGDAINTETNEGDVLVAPDESFLIVTARGRSDSLSKSDLYISFQRSDGTWTPAENMGETINSEETEYCPMLSPDGKYLFFTSTRTGNGDIYWMDAGIIDELRR